MSNERDELAPPYLVGVTDDFPGGNDDDLVEWAFEAGVQYQAWHSKPRTITTAEELDALPEGSVILSNRDEDSAQKDGEGYWYLWGGDIGLTPEEIALPATVLHNPEAAS